jgi:hypothetical protein
VVKTKYEPERPTESFKGLLRELVKRYEFDVQGLYMKDGSIRPLPRESAVVGKVLEVSIKEYLSRQLLQVNDLRCLAASSDRTYPDFTFDGSLVYPNRFAVDLKCARRNQERRPGLCTRSPSAPSTPSTTRRPTEKVGNIMMPYGDYSAHLAVIALYDYANATAQNVRTPGGGEVARGHQEAVEHHSLLYRGVETHRGSSGRKGRFLLRVGFRQLLAITSGLRMRRRQPAAGG